MKTLKLEPETASYLAENSADFVSSNLTTGLNLFGSDVQNTPKPVTVQFNCSSEQYDYLCAFHRYCVRNSSLPFQLNLILDKPILTTHKCLFVPDTFVLIQQDGNSYIVTCNLEVMPIIYDPDTDEDLIDG